MSYLQSTCIVSSRQAEKIKQQPIQPTPIIKEFPKEEEIKEPIKLSKVPKGAPVYKYPSSENNKLIGKGQKKKKKKVKEYVYYPGEKALEKIEKEQKKNKKLNDLDKYNKIIKNIIKEF